METRKRLQTSERTEGEGKHGRDVAGKVPAQRGSLHAEPSVASRLDFDLWLLLTVENWLLDFGRPIYGLYVSEVFPLSLPGLGTAPPAPPLSLCHACSAASLMSGLPSHQVTTATWHTTCSLPSSSSNCVRGALGQCPLACRCALSCSHASATSSDQLSLPLSAFHVELAGDILCDGLQHTSGGGLRPAQAHPQRLQAPPLSEG